MKLIYTTLIVLVTASPSLWAQANFQQYPTPVGFDDNYRLVVDYYSDNQILFPVFAEDTFYIKGSSGGFVAKETGLYITAFYADNGDLYLVENTNPGGHTPKLLKSTNNGDTFTEITGVSGRVFERDHRGNLFYGVPGGFAYSTNDGASFTTVTTPDSVFSAAFNPPNNLYYLSDSTSLFKSVDNGANWQDISKTNAIYFELEQRIQVINDTVYYQSLSGAYFAPDTATAWRDMFFIPFSSIFTHLNIAPDLAFFGYGAYGFFTTNTPYDRNWTPLRTLGGASQETIYNHYSAITDSGMYVYSFDSSYFYAPRTPNLVGLNEIGSQSQLVALYPNPAHGEVTLITDVPSGQFQLYNLQGQAVLTETVQHSTQTVNVGHLAPGMYIWQLGSKKGKLVVE